MLDLMRRYAYGFVNSHDPQIARQIMSPDYRLNMGSDVLVGRDSVYLPAVMHQIAQFPSLTFSIHALITDGGTTALMFSEHGASARYEGKAAAWRGVSIYRAVGGRLAECWVEQDHLGRRHQLATGNPDPVSPVAMDPWSGHHAPSPKDRQTGEAALKTWATELTSWPPENARVDAGSAGHLQPVLAVDRVTTNAVVVEGARIAFNVTIAGTYEGGLPDFEHIGTRVEIYVGAFATVAAGGLADIDAISNRVAVQRQLREASAEMHA